jgi:fructose-1,6-bisphosphatase/inositol monophosphatase family enzyme
LCVLEAGGKVTDFAGEWSQDAQSGTRILASNGHVHDQAVTVIRLGDAAPRPQSQ